MSNGVTASRLRPIAEREIPDEPEPQAPQAENDHGFSSSILLLALGSLSKRAVVALHGLFTLLTASSAFVLWYLVLGEPSVLKLIGATTYSVFVLALEFVRKR